MKKRYQDILGLNTDGNAASGSSNGSSHGLNLTLASDSSEALSIPVHISFDEGDQDEGFKPPENSVEVPVQSRAFADPKDHEDILLMRHIINNKAMNMSFQKRNLDLSSLAKPMNEAIAPEMPEPDQVLPEVAAQVDGPIDGGDGDDDGAGEQFPPVGELVVLDEVGESSSSTGDTIDLRPGSWSPGSSED